MRPRIAVIGGGISGLAAAYELANSRSPVEVVLLEAGKRLGGVLETVQQDGFLIESAADNFLTKPTAAVELCQRVGLEESLIVPDTMRRKAFVVHNGTLQPIPAGFLVMAPSRIGPMLSTRLLTVRGKLRLALEYFIPRNRNGEDESIASFIRRRFGSEIFARLVQPLVGGIYGADLEQLSIDATMPRFRDMEQEHRSLIRAMLRQRRTQIHEACSGARYGQFAALRNGMSSLVGALARCLPPESIQLASPVDRIAQSGDRGWLITIGGARPRRQEIDALILATPAYAAAKLVEDIDSELADRLAQIEYTSCAVVSLGYRRWQIKHPLDGFGFVVPLIEQRNVFSCSFSSIKYEGRAPDNSVLMRVYIGGACQNRLLQLSNGELVELAALELRDLLDIDGGPVLQHVTRHHRAMAQYRVGHRDLVATVNLRLQRFPTLALAGSAYQGVGVPSCIQSGQAAANQLLSRLKAHLARPVHAQVEAEAVV
ncbi:MAG TPA: protoporphyrinogen oxidase [Lacipirellulaceae bacterium]|nr:protoporphyrinogen oxidase [Lacipirellulaceae bacterium]